LIHNWGQLCQKFIDSIICDFSGKYFYLLYLKNDGYYLKHYSIEDKRCVQDHHKIHEHGDFLLDRLRMSYDGSYLFTYGDKSIKQWKIDSKDGTLTLAKHFTQVMQNSISSIALTKNLDFLYAGDWAGNLVKFNIKTSTVSQNFGKVMNRIWKLGITPDEKFLFVGGENR